jgi:alginate O-acetyltransferase complex protein AlgI
MAFDSLAYFLFLAATVAVYWALPHRPQNILLVFASWLFYGWWNWHFLPLLLAATALDFALSHCMEASPSPQGRRRILWLSIAINVCFLAVFKYFNFFIDTVGQTFHLLGHDTSFTFARIVLPIGISFYTFESIAYMVSVYRCELPAVRSFVDYALFIAFFPHLIAGPIMQPAIFIPQCLSPRSFSGKRFVNGLDLIVWGLLKKMFIADGIGHYVDWLFSLRDPSTDMARGSAKLMGFELRHNFNAPYSARSIVEFWRRWHISLSNWIRDYIYIPLGGSRVSNTRYCFNIVVTWALCGLWHGAAWKFIVWGLYYGAFIIFERFRKNSVKNGLSQWFKTWVLVQFAWLIFRAPSMSEFMSYFSVEAILRSAQDWRVSWAILCIFGFFLLPWFIKRLWDRFRGYIVLTGAQRWETRVMFYSLTVLILALFGKAYSNAFIYFQF